MSKTSKKLTYISIFSGIEAASVAWEPLGFKPVAFAEVDPFPSAVLKERYPHVPNLGDITKIDWSEYRDKVDIVVGGSPCQSFSIAGTRSGLSGESGLMFEYIRAVREIRPKVFCWENVCGALSSEKGAAFHQLLSEMDDLGYGLAWRVLDAQFVRVPDRDGEGFVGPVAQRRRRVFLVGCLGDPQGAAEILFEPESLRWDHPSSREKRKELTRAAQQRAAESGEPGGLTYCIQGDIARGAHMGQNGCGYSDDGASYTLNTMDHHAVAFKRCQEPEVKGHSPAVFLSNGDDDVGALCASDSKWIGNQYVKDGKVICMADATAKDAIDSNLCGTMTAHAQSEPPIVCMASGQANSEIEVDMAPAQAARQCKDPQIVCMQESVSDSAICGDITPPIKAVQSKVPTTVCTTQYGEEVAGTLMAKADSSPCHDKGANVMTDGYIVRRLTPLECERLQGFPDGWTKIPYKGKPADDCPDTPRYKALGNSMATPVMRLIGSRILASWKD